MKTYSALTEELRIFDPTNATIYCDMDQVLVNFLAGARDALGKEFNDESLGTADEKFRFLATVPDFWVTLKWMPNAAALWEHLTPFNPHILSACPEATLNPSCPMEKRVWCQRNLAIPTDRIHTVRREEKKGFAVTNNRPNLLIDDHPKNVGEWEMAGGVAIRHFSVPETITQLTRLGL